MADNLAITAGSGTTIAADDISSVYYQRVKSVVGANGVAVDPSANKNIAGTDTPTVTLTSDNTILIAVAPTVGTGAYTADDCLGGEMTLTNAASVSGQGGMITGITMSAEDDAADGWAANNVEVIFWESDPAGTYTDNTALAVSDADAILVVGSVLLDTKVDMGNVTLLYARNVGLSYQCVGTANLFATAVNRGGVTPEATDAIQFKFHCVRD